jgi:hypothetical protein
MTIVVGATCRRPDDRNGKFDVSKVSPIARLVAANARVEKVFTMSRAGLARGSDKAARRWSPAKAGPLVGNAFTPTA